MIGILVGSIMSPNAFKILTLTLTAKTWLICYQVHYLKIIIVSFKIIVVYYQWKDNPFCFDQFREEE